MKRMVIALFALTICVITAHAITFNGAPQVINYQGRLTDGAGNPVSDGPHTVDFKIWDDSSLTGALHIFWDSGPVSVTTDKGLFSVKLGSPPQAPLSSLTFYDTLIFLGITVGADPEISPRTRLTSVPFAMAAQNAVTASTAGTAYYLVPSSMPSAGTISVVLGSTTSATPVSLGQFTVTAPGSGYFVMNASGMVYMDADAPSTHALTVTFQIGLCSSPGSSGTCGNTYYYHYVQDADSTDSFNQTPTFSLNETFYVPAAGSYTYYINGESDTPPYRLWGYQSAQVNVLFVPSTLTISSPTPPNPTNGPQKQQ